ncbi:MAG: sugar ABC transporter substrate-binding protein [Candidatus Hydrogenedentes bacterium]|nr:sugar ABC transporter substrate-binding protein [Candidatus Hydrogenedentota bacterium]
MREDSRRSFLQWSTSSLALGALTTAFSCNETAPADAPAAAPAALPATPAGMRYKAAFSNAGLKATWCAHGMKTAEWWGRQLGIDVTIYDSQLNIDKQRQDIEDMVTKDWDFVAIQAYAIQTLADPVKRLIDKGIPVIDFDTRIVPEGEDIGLWTFMTPDHEKLAEQATEMICQAIGGKGKIVHTQGALAHTGAQLRAKGFHTVVAKYPGIEVIDEQPADWDINKAGQIWDDLLVKYPEIDASFCHNDDMAMAARQAIKRSGKERNIVFGSIDAQEQGINGVMSGDLICSAMNAAGRIHLTALMVGYFACAQGQKKDQVPPFMIIDNPVVTKDNAAGFKYLMENKMI